MAAPFIYRFAHDLRIEDHAGLVQAAAHGDVLPVFVIDRALETRLARCLLYTLEPTRP